MTTSSPLLSPDPADPSSPANMRRRKSLVRRIERCCSVSLKHFPLLFVYGVTTWAVFTGVRICLVWPVDGWIAYTSLFLIVLLYGLLNWSYTVAVFTDPGSPLDPPSTNTSFAFSLRRKDSTARGEYSYLPTTEPAAQRPTSPPFPSNGMLSTAATADQGSVRSLTVKSTGGLRFCKKCQTRKPDRAHHCSTCGRCVLKMDHHCPWLATCVGLKNYKAFLLFCLYVTLFCAVCFVVAASFVGNGMLSDRLQANGDWFAVNVILLAILAGIFALVLAGFTAWHIHLTLKNQTTIEALETTRYLRPIRRTMDRATAAFPARSALGNGDEEEGLMHQLAEMHANAVPGVTREEEGEERRSPGRGPSPSGRYPHPGSQVPLPAPTSSAATNALHSSYARLEAQRERQRYEEYLDENETAKMPHAFDRGWRTNLFDLIGSDWRLWLLPLPSTPGDGWSWNPSERWARAQEERRRQREERGREQGMNGTVYSDGIHDGDEPSGVPTSIPYAGEEFRGVNHPLPLSGSYKSRERDTEASSVEALFARDDEEGEGGEGGRAGEGERDGEGEGEGEWRWE